MTDLTRAAVKKKCWSYTWPAAIMISISPSDPLPPDAAVTEIRHFLRHFSRVAALFFFFGTRSRSQRVTAECNGIGAEPKRAVTFTTHIHASAVPLLLNSRITRRKKKENRLQKKKKRVRYIDEIVDISRKYLKVGPKIESWSRRNP